MYIRKENIVVSTRNAPTHARRSMIDMGLVEDKVSICPVSLNRCPRNNGREVSDDEIIQRRFLH
jgi:hypothetical protein